MFTAIKTYAQDGNIQSLIIDAGGLISVLTGVAFALALLVFLWGLAVFIFRTGDESRVSDGKRLMVWGIVALLVPVEIHLLREVWRMFSRFRIQPSFSTVCIGLYPKHSRMYCINL